MSRETELNKQWSAIMRADMDLAEVLIDMAEWDADDWTEDFVRGIGDGEYDENLDLIRMTLDSRYSTIGKQPVAADGSVVTITVGQHAQITQSATNKRLRGAIVKVMARNRTTFDVVVVKRSAMWNASGRGEHMDVGARVKAAGAVLVPWNDEIPPQCEGWTNVLRDNMKNACPNNADAAVGTKQCQQCTNREASAVESKKTYDVENAAREAAAKKEAAEAAALQAKIDASRKKATGAAAASVGGGRRRKFSRGS